MTRTSTAGAAQPGRSGGSQEFTSALLQNGPAQVGGMVTSVILVGQAFARFSDVLAPFAAFIFSFLLAIYQVWLVQKANARQCCVIVPIAGLILFALALGSNNSIAPRPENSLLQKELLATKNRLELTKKELANANALIGQLRKVLNLPASSVNPEGEAHSRVEPGLQDRRSGIGGSWWSRFFGGVAHAQPVSEEELERQKALRALEEYSLKQRELQAEQQRLQAEQEKLRLEQQKQQQEQSLWRKW